MIFQFLSGFQCRCGGRNHGILKTFNSFPDSSLEGQASWKVGEKSQLSIPFRIPESCEAEERPGCVLLLSIPFRIPADAAAGVGSWST